jgi:hypothetical protein
MLRSTSVLCHHIYCVYLTISVAAKNSGGGWFQTLNILQYIWNLQHDLKWSMLILYISQTVYWYTKCTIVPTSSNCLTMTIPKQASLRIRWPRAPNNINLSIMCISHTLHNTLSTLSSFCHLVCNGVSSLVVPN